MGLGKLLKLWASDLMNDTRYAAPARRDGLAYITIMSARTSRMLALISLIITDD